MLPNSKTVVENNTKIFKLQTCRVELYITTLHMYSTTISNTVTIGYSTVLDTVVNLQ